MDKAIFLWINSFAQTTPWLDWLGIFLAVFGIYALVIWVLFLSTNKKLRPKVYLAIVSAILSRLIIVEPIKFFVNRPRPFESIPDTHLLLKDLGHGRAFSSGHAVIMFAIAFSFYGTRWFWPLFTLAALSSIARIFVGVHYPFDILTSIAIAAVTVWATKRLFKKQFGQK